VAQAERGEVDAGRGLVDLAAGARGEEVAVDRVADGDQRRRHGGELGVELGVGGVSRRAVRTRRGVQAAVVARVIEVRVVGDARLPRAAPLAAA